MRPQAFFSRMPHFQTERGSPAELLIQWDLSNAQSVSECADPVFVRCHVFGSHVQVAGDLVDPETAHNVWMRTELHPRFGLFVKSRFPVSECTRLVCLQDKRLIKSSVFDQVNNAHSGLTLAATHLL